VPGISILPPPIQGSRPKGVIPFSPPSPDEVQLALNFIGLRRMQSATINNKQNRQFYCQIRGFQFYVCFFKSRTYRISYFRRNSNLYILPVFLYIFWIYHPFLDIINQM